MLKVRVDEKLKTGSERQKSFIVGMFETFSDETSQFEKHAIVENSQSEDSACTL